MYINRPSATDNTEFDDPKCKATQLKVMSSAQYLKEHMKDVPIHVIPCIATRTDLGQNVAAERSMGYYRPSSMELYASCSPIWIRYNMDQLSFTI